MEFFALRTPPTAALAEWTDDVVLDEIRCPRYPGHRRGGRRLTDLTVRMSSADVPSFLWTWQSDLLIREDVVEAFPQHGLSGWQTQPATVHGPSGQRVPAKYWELVVTGRAGTAPRASGVQVAERCEYCGHTRYTCFDRPDLIIDPSQWDGTDLFTVWPLPLFRMISARARGVIEDNRLRGVRVVPVTELRCTAGLTPGLRDWYLPRAQATQVSGSSG